MVCNSGISGHACLLLHSMFFYCVMFFSGALFLNEKAFTNCIEQLKSFIKVKVLLIQRMVCDLSFVRSCCCFVCNTHLVCELDH